MKLIDSISIVKGIGPKSAKKFEKIDIKTIKDLLYYFPRDWIDYSKPNDIAKIRIGANAVIKAKVSEVKSDRIYRRHMTITRATLTDENNNSIQAVWFNQPFIENVIKKDSVWIFEGKVGYDFKKKLKSITISNYEKKAKIFPVYPETEGLNSKFIRKILSQIIDKIKIKENLPDQILKNYNLLNLSDSIKNIHLPKDKNNLIAAKESIAIRELLQIVYTQLKRKRKYKSFSAYALDITKKDQLTFEKSLPFELTLCQQKAIYEILNSLKKSYPMTRLLNGDVGSGKTVVAVFAIYACIKNKLRSAWLVPTEILAIQHFEKLKKYFKFDKKISISLITSKNLLDKNNKKISKSKALEADVIIGTHAIIQKDINIKNLALVVVDEEHRFGVKQRSKLIVANTNKYVPHYLSLTATPIPRTLAISLYGDLDISVLDAMPSGRKKIITKLVPNQFRAKTYEFIKKHIDNGRQIYIVCPLIEESENMNNLFSIDQKSVLNEFQKLSKIFDKYRISLLHGKLASSEKNKIMNNFSKGKIDMLISTSVIEVGIDVANASIMLIEDADRFGLAQLHQFRGRVGRGKHQSFCLMFSNNTSVESKKRLLSMEKYHDGFTLAKVDLKFRGPGDLIAYKQSGYNKLKIASITDTILLSKTKQIANYLVNKNINYAN